MLSKAELKTLKSLHESKGAQCREALPCRGAEAYSGAPRGLFVCLARSQ